MILEHALLRIEPGHEREFEDAFTEARRVIARADGFRGIELWRGIEEPSAYHLLVRWDSVEDHMDRFRGSELYQRWSELLRPHFSQPPEVAHAAPIEVADTDPERRGN